MYYLHLEENDLTIIQEGTLADLNLLRSVDISDNPVHTLEQGNKIYFSHK